MKNQNQTKTNPLKNVKNWNWGVPLEPENQPTLIGTSHLVSLLLDAWFLPSGAWWIWLFLLVNCVNPSWSITKLGLWWGLWTGHFPSALPPSRSFNPGLLFVLTQVILLNHFLFHPLSVVLQLSFLFGTSILCSLIFSPCVLFYHHWFSPHACIDCYYLL